MIVGRLFSKISLVKKIARVNFMRTNVLHQQPSKIISSFMLSGRRDRGTSCLWNQGVSKAQKWPNKTVQIQSVPALIDAYFVWKSSSFWKHPPKMPVTGLISCRFWQLKSPTAVWKAARSGKKVAKLATGVWRFLVFSVSMLLLA